MRRIRSTAPVRPLAVLLAALCLGPALAAAQEAPSGSTVTPVARDSAFWTQRFEEINARIAAQEEVDLLFVGDSITHWFEGTRRRRGGGTGPAPGQPVWDEFYAERGAANIGIAGDRTQHVLWRLENGNVDGISPQLSVVMIGTNNARANSAEEIADGIVAVVQKLEQKLPETKVLLLAIFPRGREPSEVREKLARASELAAGRLEDDPRVRYLDIGASFLGEGGVLPRDVMPDALHPNEKGYRIWAEAIEPVVAELLGESVEP